MVTILLMIQKLKKELCSQQDPTQHYKPDRVFNSFLFYPKNVFRIPRVTFNLWCCLLVGWGGTASVSCDHCDWRSQRSHDREPILLSSDQKPQLRAAGGNLVSMLGANNLKSPRTRVQPLGFNGHLSGCCIYTLHSQQKNKHCKK